MKGLLSEPPEVVLVSGSTKPFALSIAAARTCYSSRGVIRPEETAGETAKSDEERARVLAQSERIAETTYKAGHHTVYQHAHFTFALNRVSRQFVWTFLHSHPFYNSEQVSQRYVEVKSGALLIPEMPPDARRVYENTLETQFSAYHALIEILLPEVESRYQSVFRNRDITLKRWSSDIRRKAQELARYVLPVATFTYMYHTVSALTLFRYKRLCDMLDTPFETRLVVNEMIRKLLEVEPEFAKLVEEEIPLEETPEYQYGEGFFTTSQGSGETLAESFRKEFDAELGDLTSVLVGWKQNNESLVAEGVREVLGVPKTAMTDAEAIRLAMDPAANRVLGESLDLTMMSKVTRAMGHAHYTFRKKLSHTADSQEQRHRMLPASRPVLFFQMALEPDYITPALIRESEAAKRLYDETMQRTWEGIREVLRRTGDREIAQYLMPNAVAIRFQESGDLTYFWHKWVLRLCFNAQEEIYRSTREEVLQVQRVNPEIGKYLSAPCFVRMKAGKAPYCPEGTRYCGIPVWRNTVAEYRRPY